MRINICWKHFDSTKDILQGLLTQDGEQFANQLAVIKDSCCNEYGSARLVDGGADKDIGNTQNNITFSCHIL